MNHSRRALAIVAPALLLVALSGCSLLSTQDAEPTTGVPACVPGHTWSTDLKDLDAQLTAYLTKHGLPTATVVSTGSQTLEWPDSDKVKLTTDYTTVVSVPNVDGTVVTKITEVHKGPASGIIYLNGPIAVPRDWDDSAFKMTATADINGTATEPLPFAVPETVLNDEVALDVTCDGKSMTMLAHGALVTIKWDRTK
ncbi:MAG: hypothetical protein ABJB03_08155 [Rhodoglobus sp.]